MDIHIGKIVKKFIRERRISNRELGEKIGVNVTTASNLLRRRHTHTKVMIRLCDGLNHNFFKYYSDHYDGGKTEEYIKELETKLSEAEKKIEKLTIENELYGRVLEGNKR